MINKQKVTLIRIYTDDSHDHINQLLDQLHQRKDVVGATVFRGVAGFGQDRQIHQNHIIDLSSKLPIVVELFHKSENSDNLIQFIHQQVSHIHIISWNADLSFEQID